MSVLVQARQRAAHDPEYLHGVLMEVQRLWPPFIGGRRLADQVGLFKSELSVNPEVSILKDDDRLQECDEDLPYKPLPLHFLPVGGSMPLQMSLVCFCGFCGFYPR